METPDKEQEFINNTELPFQENFLAQTEYNFENDGEAASYAELDDLQQLILRHTVEYPQWLEKMQDWTIAQLLQRLRSIDIHTSKMQLEEYAESAKSALHVSNTLLTTAENSTKAIDKLSMLWAAVELLWQKMFPEWLNVEEMLKKAAKLAMSNKNAEIVLNDFVALFDTFIEELCAEEEALNYDIIAEWCTLNAEWLNDVMAYWLQVIVKHFDSIQKIHLPTAQMVDKLHDLIEDLATRSANFAQIRLYLALINGADKEVKSIIEQIEEVMEPGKEFYEFLGQFYGNPPVYAFTTANPTLSMMYYEKMMDNLDIEA